MAESFLKDHVHLYSGDCLEVLPTLAENSVDSCVTDPPYHLVSIIKRFGSENSAPAQFGSDGLYERSSRGFMGKVWDGGDIAFRPEVWAAVYRVLKPGSHLIAMGGTRTFHRLVCAIEDAGFEVRDTIGWLYGSGFPKSHDVSKGIDRAAGAEREVVGVKVNTYDGAKRDPSKHGNPAAQSNIGKWGLTQTPHGMPETAPATDAARQWEGWGTALKPAMELICLARKPLSEKTIAANVLRWGTGAINVDGCRVEAIDGVPKFTHRRENAVNCYGDGKNGSNRTGEMDVSTGRWPANVIHDGSEEVVAAFPETTSGNLERVNGCGEGYGFCGQENIGHVGDSGSAARFFYTAKADSNDRLGSKHPTVKPIDLMQWLVRLITPPGGTVLDPFAGTGTTGEAAWREIMKTVLIEREAEYQEDIRRRMKLCLAGPDERVRESIKARGLTDSPGPLFDAFR